MDKTYQLTRSDYFQPLMIPIPGDHPCGESLDYDPAFIMLQSKLQPKLDVEYGNFFEAAEPVNWTEIERDCLSLLQKSKDIRLVIILMRCRLRKAGIPALEEGLEALLALLQIWPDDTHPQLLDEGDFAPELRANAFSELENTHGLLADLRNLPLPRASGLQITIKEFEKAHQIPREEDALSDTAVAALIHDWHANAREGIAPLGRAHLFLQEIKKNLDASLESESPEFKVLDGVLSLFTKEFGSEPLPQNNTIQATSSQNVQVSEEETEAVAFDSAIKKTPVAATNAGTVVSNESGKPGYPQQGIQNRTDALHQLQEVRSWFAMTEPSSPVALLLKYAEESIGKNFTDLIKMYPSEIIAILDQDKE